MSVNWDDFTPVNPPAQGGVNWDDFTPIEPKKRVPVPDMSVGSIAQDIASGALQIGLLPSRVWPTLRGSLLATVWARTPLKPWSAAWAQSATWWVLTAPPPSANFQADMADDDVGIGETLARNKGALADPRSASHHWQHVPARGCGWRSWQVGNRW